MRAHARQTCPVSVRRIQQGYAPIYFFDAAVTEDLNSGSDPENNPSPSTRFLMLQGEPDDQAAKQITQYTQAKIERVLEHYDSKITKDPRIPQLTLDDLRKNFICYSLRATHEPGLRTLVTAFITYCTEWDFRKDHFEYGVAKGTSEPFFLHLFRGCILFESLLKHNPFVQPNSKTLGKILNEKKIINELSDQLHFGAPVEPTVPQNLYKAVYLTDELGEFSAEDIKAHPEVIVTKSFDEFKFHAGSKIALWVDKNAVNKINRKWLNQPPQKYYPLVLIGYNDPLYCFREILPLGRIEGPYVDWSKEVLEPGFCVWMILVEDESGHSSTLSGSKLSPTIQDILDVTNQLLEEDQDIQSDK